MKACCRELIDMRWIVPGVWRALGRSYNPWRTPDEEPHAANDHLRSQLRHGRQAADRPAEDGRWQQVPPDLDRPPRGRRDPDEAPGRVDAATDDPRPPLGRSRAD